MQSTFGCHLLVAYLILRHFQVLSIDPDRKRIMLTAKKTLVDSDLPIVSRIQDVEAGMLTHGVIWKVNEKNLIVEFYNHIRAVVPINQVR